MERTDSHKLSFDLHTCAMVHICPHIHAQNKYMLKKRIENIPKATAQSVKVFVAQA